jgi:endonuclease YncB( thermonuclease family)
LRFRHSIAVLCLAIAPAWSATLEGRVVRVHDGATITVVDANKQQHKIRLAGIDAPALSQPFGPQSKQNLSGMVYGKNVTVEWTKRKGEPRIVGKVLYVPPCPPGMSCIMSLGDANLDQIHAGLAWHSKPFEHEQTPEDRFLYDAAETAARGRKVGLWADPNPVPPWEWRKMQKGKS